MSEKTEKTEKSKHRDRRGRDAARKSGEPVLATADGKEAATALLKAAVQWRNEAQQYTTDHGRPPMDRPTEGPWHMEAAEAKDHIRVRFLHSAHNYVWAKALGWDAKASGGRLLNAALHLPATPKRKKRKPEAA